MAQLVTTSSHHKPRLFKTTAVLCATMALAIVLSYFLFHNLTSGTKPSTVPTTTSVTNAVVTVTNGQLAVENEASATLDPKILRVVNSPKVIRPNRKPDNKADTNRIDTTRIHKATFRVLRFAESNVISRTPAQFSTKTEKFLSAYIKSSKHPAMIFPTISPDMEEDCIKALQTDIIIYEDDSEEIQAHKEAVAALKQDLLKALEEGYSVTDCLNEMRKVNNSNVRERSRMQHQLNHLLQDGDAEAAVKYFNEANARLDECGLPHILYLEEMYFGKGRRHKNGETDRENKESNPEAGQTL